MKKSAFCAEVVDRLEKRVAVVKPQIAFFERLGWRGLRALDAIVDHFESMLEAIRDPDGYGVWQIPVISGRVPGLPGDA